MFYAVRTQQITDNATKRELLQFYNKKDRASYLEIRGDAKPISAKEAHKVFILRPKLHSPQPRGWYHILRVHYLLIIKSKRGN